LGSKQHHGDSAQRSDHRQRGGDSGGWSSEFWRYLRSDGGTEHHIADAEHWGSGIVDSDCWIQLWPSQGNGNVKFNGVSATTITSWEQAASRRRCPAGDHRQRGSDGGGRSGEFWRSLHGDGSTEHHIANAEHWGSGSSIVIAGTNFGATQGNGGVTYNGTSATTITSWGASSITATVPSAATTGTW